MSEHARLLVFDIETYRTRNAAVLERIRAEALEKRPAQNVAKEIKLEWDTERAREARALEAVKKTSVDWLLAESLCCSWRADGEAFGVQMMHGHEGPFEKRGLELLSEAWSEQAGPDTIWVGHNVLGFDLPVLLNCFRRWDIRPPEHFPRFVNGRWHGRVYDTMKRTPTDNGLGFVSFAKVCEACGVEGAKSVLWNGEPMHGGRVGDAFEAGEYDLIEEYCASDVEVNETLYMRMTCDDTWGTYDTRQDMLDRIAEIDGAVMSAGAKALAKIMVLEDAGVLARSA